MTSSCAMQCCIALSPAAQKRAGTKNDELHFCILTSDFCLKNNSGAGCGSDPCSTSSERQYEGFSRRESPTTFVFRCPALVETFVRRNESSERTAKLLKHRNFQKKDSTETVGQRRLGVVTRMSLFRKLLDSAGFCWKNASIDASRQKKTHADDRGDPAAD